MVNQGYGRLPSIVITYGPQAAGKPPKSWSANVMHRRGGPRASSFPAGQDQARGGDSCACPLPRQPIQPSSRIFADNANGATSALFEANWARGEIAMLIIGGNFKDGALDRESCGAASTQA